MTGRRLAVAALVAALAGCTTTATTTGVTPRSTFGPAGDDKAHALIAHCGLERWAVKTGSDPGASQVDLGQVTDSAVPALGALPVPPGIDQAPGVRAGPAETTVYRVAATLTGFKQEADSDYHLVLSDDGHTMIAEIPLPACVAQTSPFLPGIAAARAVFDARFTPTGEFTAVAVPVTVTGVGFFDRIHGQTGVAPNGIELHPVLSIQIGS